MRPVVDFRVRENIHVAVVVGEEEDLVLTKHSQRRPSYGWRRSNYQVGERRVATTKEEGKGEGEGVGSVVSIVNRL
ncbi:hypothetical protein B296_00053484 [Ensete ventricosum]|uniref:Uncharacterized protein n=1 Tax=Ensete ventricosum TaxID=4639 RepID=A0A426X7Z6_ENSVE|nr:hypothetical protein B296_00053484 [Ensete ventricosum]